MRRPTRNLSTTEIGTVLTFRRRSSNIVTPVCSTPPSRRDVSVLTLPVRRRDSSPPFVLRPLARPSQALVRVLRYAPAQVAYAEGVEYEVQLAVSGREGDTRRVRGQDSAPTLRHAVRLAPALVEA